MSLKVIKNKIRGVAKTHKVTKAMEAVSAVKMRKSQERALLGRPYATTALSILRRVSGSIEVLGNPLTVVRPVSRVCMVVITSDKGLAGVYNSAVLRAAENTIRHRGISKENIGIIAIGKKSLDFFGKRGYTILQSFVNMSDSVSISDTTALTRDLAELYSNKSYDECIMVFTNFISTFQQEAVVRSVLPLKVEEIVEIVKGITPKKGKYANVSQVSGSASYSVEPSPEAVLSELMPYLLSIMLYHILLEAKASEHSSRMVAMKNASDKARDLGKELTVEYNKARQAQITREIGEIVGGIEAMA